MMFGHSYLIFFVIIQFLYLVDTNVVDLHKIVNRTASEPQSPIPQVPSAGINPKEWFHPTYQLSAQLMQKPEQHPPVPFVDIEEGNFFEGDIILRPEQLALRKIGSQKQGTLLWPRRVLVYDFSNEFNASQRARIERALAELQRETCVRFVRRTNERTYIRLRNTKRGCASQVGYHPTGQGIDLFLSAPGCLRTGTIQHEFLHALGFWHEHTRPDRDKYISILWSNIIPGRELNFRARYQYEPHEWLPYDYNSVMHYRAVAFSKDRLSATIIPSDHRAFFTIGQRRRYSSLDLAKLNILYQCGPGYYSGDVRETSMEEELEVDSIESSESDSSEESLLD